MKKAKLGFIGVGNFGRKHHWHTALNSENMKICSAAELNQDRWNRLKTDCPDVYLTTDYKEIINDPEIDIVVICTKQDLHAPLSIEALDAGKWVFVEKPMAETFEESNQVIEAEQRNPGRLAVGFNRRFAPAIQDSLRLMENVPRPWFINYRLMGASFAYAEKGAFYEKKAHMHYEGCHILDLVCWFLKDKPKRVVMTGDLHNNCSILEFEDGSQVSFMCGSMGTWGYFKEYMEIFSAYHAITISEYMDMKVRGFENEYDRVFAPDKNYRAEEVLKYGLPFWEKMCNDRAYYHRDESYNREMYLEKYGLDVQLIEYPVPLPVEAKDIGLTEEDENLTLQPDKGWKDSLVHFAQCYLDRQKPDNADSHAGALADYIADRMLESMNKGRPVSI